MYVKAYIKSVNIIMNTGGGAIVYEIQPKKLLIINILDILKKYSDEDHRLTQKDIIELLKRDYNMTVDRKSVKSNLMNLIEAGYHINYSEITRSGKAERKV